MTRAGKIPYNNTSIQKDEIIPLFSIGDLRINRPPMPIKSVMINWLMLPAIVNEIALILFPSSIYNTRPKYSPTRFGVVTEKLTPDKTALNAVKKLIRCIF